MTRPKRTAEEIRNETMKMITKLKEINEDARKTKLANVLGINNTLMTTTIDGLMRDKLIRKAGKGYELTDGGKGWLMITEMSKDEAGKMMRKMIE